MNLVLLIRIGINTIFRIGVFFPTLNSDIKKNSIIFFLKYIRADEPVKISSDYFSCFCQKKLSILFVRTIGITKYKCLLKKRYKCYNIVLKLVDEHHEISLLS